MQQIFEHASSLGDVPILLVGDFQTNPSESKILGIMTSNGLYHDLGAMLSDSAWTYQKGNDSSIRTRIDLALCNNIMLPLLKSFEIVDSSGLPAHRPLKITLSLSPHEDIKHVYRHPRSLPIQKHSSNHLRTVDEAIWLPRIGEWNEQLRSISDHHDLQKGINDLFQTWTTCAESCVLQATNTRGPSYRGRGSFPKVITKSVAAPPANEHMGAATVHLLSLLKLLRRFQQLYQKDFHVPVDSHTHKQLSDLRRQCLTSWQRLLPKERMPDLSNKSDVFDAVNFLENNIQEAQINISNQRIQTWKEKLLVDWQSSKKATYRWIRDSEPCMIPLFRTDIHEYAVKHRELH